MVASNTYGRQVVLPLTNKSGGSVIAGDVVVIGTANDSAFTTSTAGAFLGLIGIAQETIADNATGRVLTAGYAALVNVDASVTRQNFGKTHTVAKQATDAGASRVVGVFCQFLKAGTTPDAVLFGLADASSATGNVATDAIWDADGDLAVGTGANTAARLASGALGTLLTGVAVGTAPAWTAPVLPRYVFVVGVSAPSATTGFTANVDLSSQFGDYRISTSAQNDTITWPVTLDAGTYTLTLIHSKGTSRGIYTIKIDGSSVGTIDGYNGSTTNNVTDLASIAVTGGYHTVEFLMATKNGSSSAYYGIINGFSLTRTGA
jgi:hypothetical protein